MKLLILIGVIVTQVFRTPVHGFSFFPIILRYRHKDTQLTTTIKHERSRPVSSMNSLTTSTVLSNDAQIENEARYTTLFDFSEEGDVKKRSLESFERIDDAIMGGISLSQFRDVPRRPFASWSGVCRTDGGGFCGTRTLPLAQPLNGTDYDGIFMDCRLASDNEPERRVWKVSVRTDRSRGEMMLYQAAFSLPKRSSSSGMDPSDPSQLFFGPEEDSKGWTRVLIPFYTFTMVRGPVVVPDGPKLDPSGGLYQLGLIMSKFKIGQSMTEMENFRAGYFDLQIQRIGFYKEKSSIASVEDGKVSFIPAVLSPKEIESKRPALLKILSPIFKLLFSEKANRRRSAMKILTEKRDMSRMQAILFGIHLRRKSIGLLPSVLKTMSILGVDTARTLLGLPLRIIFVYPSRIFRAITRIVKKLRKESMNQKLDKVRP